ncbi:hypothetical protein [Sphingomicrobium nitratireducens]|uniref:hypothetical protein n=1 Tax=Sphingomicrobium nitratireducens TaxID=2964666 RepID=UPI00223F2DA3|nr:hypothetical protein [Sphingomicrobium nitratireducens]
MDAIPFVMVLLGCVDGGATCEPITTLPAAYASEQSCMASRGEILEALGDDRIVAECRPEGSPARYAAKVTA